MPLSHSRLQFASTRLFAQETGLVANGFAFDLTGTSLLQLSAAKATTALLQDGLGDIHPPAPTALLVATPDEAGDGRGLAPGNPVLTVDAAHTIGTINTIGDQDFYQVTLEAGKTYQIGMYGYTGGPGGAPNADSYIEVYAADGTTLIVSGDGGAATPANAVNSGFDVLLTYTPDTTGTYYINARAFDQDPTNGTTGDGVGDYELFVHDATSDPSIYHPYYDVNSPLYAIDWGTQVNKVNQSARNPDGNEGTRNTGNPQGTPVYSSALDIPALAAAQGVNITGKNVVTIYFAKAGDLFVSNDPTKPGLPPATITAVGVQAFEHTAVMTALHEFEKVADIVYLEVDDRTKADFIYTSYQGTPGPGVSLLGAMSPPDEPDEGLAQFNSGDYRWNATDLQQGGFSYTTLIHEFGHGHGLAHPHDNGGHSGIMRGVQPNGPVASYTLGDYNLNQGVFTMMSYEDGWQSSPYGNAPTSGGYGYLGSLMAFDIAAIQDKYGVNEEWATGNDVYTLKDVNAIGTYFSSIWDAGGTDEIQYVGSRDTTIDLRPASLQYEYGGGGWVSYAYGIYGGFTIANGVTIENATTDAGNDTLIGNAANNVMKSGAGADFIKLQQGGDDIAFAGDGNDVILFGAALTGADQVDGGTGRDQIAIQGDYWTAPLTLGANVVNTESLAILPGSDTRFGDPGTNSYDYNVTMVDQNVAAGVEMVVDASQLRVGEDFTFNGAAETDGRFFIYGGGGTDTLTGGLGNDVFYFGEAGQFGASDHVDGGAGGTDQLGLRGSYTIVFGATQLVGIENIGMVSASDTRFGALGTNYNYNLTMNDGNVAAGQQMTVDAASLRATETLTFNGSAELDGSFRVFGGAGNDVITGSLGNDIISGGLGHDTLTGNGGNDIFLYRNLAESTSAGRDGIQDFSLNDVIDLSKIDANTLLAGDQAFSFIGTSAFGNHAGELRFENSSGPIWLVQGDVDGNGVADFELLVTVSDGHTITSADFHL
jgi:serralysin